MRGGVSVLDLMHYFSYEDRNAMYVTVKENLEMTKDLQMPLV